MTLFFTEYGGAETGGSRSEPHLLSEREPLLQHHPRPGPRRPQIPGTQAGEHDPPGHQGHLAGPATVWRGRDFCKCGQQELFPFSIFILSMNYQIQGVSKLTIIFGEDNRDFNVCIVALIILL